MFGLGGTEVFVILLAAIVVFGGPAVIGFWLGFQAGKKSGDSAPLDADENTPPETDTEETASHD